MARLVMVFLGEPRAVFASDNLDVMKTALKATPGVGQPFLFFSSIPGSPPTTLATVDFDLHPDWAGHGNVVNADVEKNKEMMQAMLDAPPLDAITMT